MECYFSSRLTEKLDDEQYNAILSFYIPDAGIMFRARFKGAASECEYASLLTLLEFVELNPQVFRDRTVEIYGDSFTVVNQINSKMFCNKTLEPFRNMALLFKKKFSYSLAWIPERENPAQNEIAAE
jgi:ribonuclease HI